MGLPPPVQASFLLASGDCNPMGKATPSVAADVLAWYEKLVATNPMIERKGATMPYTSLNGHMFSFLTKTGTLALRLPAEERDTFLKKYQTKLCEQHGSVMEEYVEVPNALLKKTQELKKYFDLSYAYVASLKPKPTKKKSGKKK
jgi:TfoX/Sxy family transcriptional regulator of competence genes